MTDFTKHECHPIVRDCGTFQYYMDQSVETLSDVCSKMTEESDHWVYDWSWYFKRPALFRVCKEIYNVFG